MLLLLINKKKWFLGTADDSKDVKMPALLDVELSSVPKILGPATVLAASSNDLNVSTPVVT